MEKKARNHACENSRYIHLCEFREKDRQYCINKFVRTTLLSKNVILVNDWHREEFLTPNFLLVQIHYYTEWLSLRGVLRPKFFIGMFL